MTATDQSRLTKEARREQLLDTAADLVAAEGMGALTMEGLAVAAGVSKALPYQHFENAEAVLVALYRRELESMGREIRKALNGVDEPREAIEKAVHAYFDAVAARGHILSVLTAPGSRVPSVADRGERVGHRFVADLLTGYFDVRPRDAMLVSSYVLAVLSGAVEAWVHRQGKRRVVEEIAVSAILASIAAVGEQAAGA